MDSMRYPIGHFTAVENPTEEQRKQLIESIDEIPNKLRQVIDGLDVEQLTTSYRPGGWTLQQVVHHLADAEMNAYIRFKRGLTEEQPLAGTFREDLWAELIDYKDTPIETSILLLEALHNRFKMLLVKMKPTDFARLVASPTHGTMTLDIAIQRFLWHAQHHIAQISSFRDRICDDKRT
ncbi:YfiT family bacillithiol transferase [Paenibacillus sp. NPDC056933]|uniref:YfiT family bacillithiol transferase n=1 Tax=Paenibacillus sp. NPDC056933 TaxID=3345968 RepID=UPI00363FBC5C